MSFLKSAASVFRRKLSRTSFLISAFLFSSAAQAVNVLIGLAVFFTFGLQFYVCLDIAWNGIKERYSKSPVMAQYIMRTVMVVICIGIAIAVPTIVPFVSLIGAFCFSIIGLLVPIAIEMLTFHEKGFGKFNWKLIKNLIVAVMAMLALIFGSKSAIEEIIDIYTPKNDSSVKSLQSALNSTILRSVLNGTDSS